MKAAVVSIYRYITLFGRLIPTYGLCMAAGFLIPSVLACIRAKGERLSVDNPLIILASAAGFGLLGANLLYVFVSYSPAQIIGFVRGGDWSFLTGGGLVFYGGLIGGVPGALLGARIAKSSMKLYIRAIVPCIPLGHAIGRIGCFLTGCCYGIACDGPLCVRFPAQAGQIQAGARVFPVQLLEALLNLMLFWFLWRRAKKPGASGSLLALYAMLYSVERFCVEWLRGDVERGVYLHLSVSQWISLALMAASGACLLVRFRQRAPSNG